MQRWSQICCVTEQHWKTRKTILMAHQWTGPFMVPKTAGTAKKATTWRQFRRSWRPAQKCRSVMMEATRLRRCSPPGQNKCLREQFFYDFAVYIGQPKIVTLEPVGECLVIET